MSSQKDKRKRWSRCLIDLSWPGMRRRKNGLKYEDPFLLCESQMSCALSLSLYIYIFSIQCGCNKECLVGWIYICTCILRCDPVCCSVSPSPVFVFLLWVLIILRWESHGVYYIWSWYCTWFHVNSDARAWVVHYSMAVSKWLLKQRSEISWLPTDLPKTLTGDWGIQRGRIPKS